MLAWAGTREPTCAAKAEYPAIGNATLKCRWRARARRLRRWFRRVAPTAQAWSPRVEGGRAGAWWAAPPWLSITKRGNPPSGRHHSNNFAMNTAVVTENLLYGIAATLRCHGPSDGGYTRNSGSTLARVKTESHGRNTPNSRIVVGTDGTCGAPSLAKSGRHRACSMGVIGRLRQLKFEIAR